ncbi:DUF998 domain-containing protein [Mycobacteroides abscessus subsp. massiliense]|uniref:DUF998 domain-containing protein n=1 Tax=Mycobacteroides abscessus TaxID=36809 RepID=UPI0019D0E834|nr:DUF998 domain-containing protein [Mycobacteroides abscessus]MBN7315324.1 DUF998 domain-containing protein [Mycobacteroides abscessus subsp. massiliense]
MTAPIARSGRTGRLGAVLIVLGPLVAWTAEIITAAAWQRPHYAPLYNWVSHLGLTGPAQIAFGQVADSPLGAVMDVGWVMYGVLLVLGVLLVFDLRQGARPLAITFLAVISGLGVSLVGIVQGSNANVVSGLIVFHTSGAQSVMLAGNLMAIIVGASGSRLGFGRGRASTSIVLGAVGLVTFPIFMADVFTGWAWNIGMFERGVIYPIMFAHVLLGTGLLSRIPGAPPQAAPAPSGHGVSALTPTPR